MQPSFEYGGSIGKFSYFVTGQHLSPTRGVEPPTPGPSPIHDQSYQGQAFGYFSYFLSPTTRLSLVTGSDVNHFQIGANPGQPQVFALSGVPVYPSAGVNENQFEQNYFGVFALQGTIGSKFDYQIAAFSRYSTVSFRPDFDGDLIFDGGAGGLPQRLRKRYPGRYDLPGFLHAYVSSRRFLRRRACGDRQSRSDFPD